MVGNLEQLETKIAKLEEALSELDERTLNMGEKLLSMIVDLKEIGDAKSAVITELCDRLKNLEGSLFPGTPKDIQSLYRLTNGEDAQRDNPLDRRNTKKS